MKGAGFPDLHHKMCKKVARLTRVIFILNTKNDEHEMTIKIMKKAYENELNKMCARANEQITTLMEEVEKVNQGKRSQLEDDLRKYKKKMSDDKIKSKSTFIEFQNQQVKSLEKAKEEADNKIQEQ